MKGIDFMDSVKEIGDIIDANILDFLFYLKDRNFNEANNLKQLLENELFRLRQARVVYAKQLVKDMKEEDLARFISTYVLEQKILDRIELTSKYKQSKDVY